MKNIFLIGFMGAGKTTAAKALSEKYGLHLVEMDEEIENREGRAISQIFAEDGENYFRRLETEFLEELGQRENLAVSCGGGAAVREENRAAMRRSGTVVYLSAAPETIYERVKGFHTRPLLEGHMNVEYISEMMKARLPVYEAAADLTVRTDGRSTEEICTEIFNRISQP